MQFDLPGADTRAIAAAANGAATFKLPALPANSTSPGAIGTAPAGAYVFQMRAYSAAQGLADGPAPNTGFPQSITTAGGNLPAINTNTVLASGEAKGVVVAGIPSTVLVLSHAHAELNLDTTLGSPIAVVQLTGVAPDALGALRIRLSSVDKAKLGGPGAIATGTFTVGGAKHAGDVVTVACTDTQAVPVAHSIPYTVNATDSVASDIATGRNATSSVSTN